MPKHYKDMMDEIINKIDEDSNTIYKVKKDGKIVFTGKYNQVLTYRKKHGGEIVTENAPTSADIDRLKKQIRFKASPRHVPSKIISVKDIPRTKNGKIVELAVKNIIEGNKIKNIQALANPEILKKYKNIKELET